MIQTKPKGKVKCADCGFYKFYPEGLKSEPLGGCENEDVLFYMCMLDYAGRNWRLNHRNSNTLRYCKGFKPKEASPRKPRTKTDEEKCREIKCPLLNKCPCNHEFSHCSWKLTFREVGLI